MRGILSGVAILLSWIVNQMGSKPPFLWGLVFSTVESTKHARRSGNMAHTLDSANCNLRRKNSTCSEMFPIQMFVNVAHRCPTRRWTTLGRSFVSFFLLKYKGPRKSETETKKTEDRVGEKKCKHPLKSVRIFYVHMSKVSRNTSAKESVISVTSPPILNRANAFRSLFLGNGC